MPRGRLWELKPLRQRVPIHISIKQRLPQPAYGDSGRLRSTIVPSPARPPCSSTSHRGASRSRERQKHPTHSRVHCTVAAAAGSVSQHPAAAGEVAGPVAEPRSSLSQPDPPLHLITTTLALPTSAFPLLSVAVTVRMWTPALNPLVSHGKLYPTFGHPSLPTNTAHTSARLEP
jgi:hypothetical protein